jgi:hypothetical protein
MHHQSPGPSIYVRFKSRPSNSQSDRINQSTLEKSAWLIAGRRSSFLEEVLSFSIVIFGSGLFRGQSFGTVQHPALHNNGVSK